MPANRPIFLLLAILLTTGVCAQSYTFKNVQIHGGGFVTGLIYNPSLKGLLYARTDVGGAYRWDSTTQSWTSLNDNLSVTQNNYTGVISLATDPIDPTRVYIATGLYSQSWAGTAAIFASQDKGNTWTEHDLTIKLGGNENGRSAGEKLQVDPNKDSILFLGTTANGLWKSTDMGVTWNQVGSFPNSTGNVSFVMFKKSSGTTGSATPVIYVGLLQTGTNLYKSTDGGATWAAITGAPTAYMPHRAALSSTGILYLAYSDNTGPNNVTGGQVWKWNTTTAVWTQIPPPYTQGGYAGITVDAQNPNTIMVSTMDRWSPRDEIYRSTNGGTTWTALLTGATYSYTQAPYVSAQTPSWIGDVEIDPFNSSNAWFVTGYGLFTSANATATPVTWTFSNTGLEELDVAGLISPPSGLNLLSVVGDQDGFRHNSLTASPTAGKYSPAYGTHTSIDFAQSNPNYLVKTHYSSTGKYGGYSTDQGVSWTSFGSYPTSSTGGGTVAVSANGSTIVLSANGAAVSYSTNNGTSWTASTGISSGLAVVSDRVTSTKFYAYDAANGNILVSTNSGASFATAATGFNAVPSYYLWATGIKAIYGIAGDVWMHNLDGLFHSTNSGATFTQIANVGMTYQVGFGKPATGTYPAVYIVGTVSGVYGFYRSDDAGSTWTQINDASHQYGTINALTGDPNTYGRIYIGTAGRGIIYGDISLALPVILDWFKATPVDRDKNTIALLQWQTLSEISGSRYTIEKTTDGIRWLSIGTVNASAGTSPGGHLYTYDDDISMLNGMAWYRLLVTGPDGKSQYSTIAGVRHSITARDFITVYPNPVTNNTCNVNVHVAQNKNVYLQLTSTDGRLLYKSGTIPVYAGNNIVPFTPVSRFPPGAYIMEVYSTEEKKKIGATVITR